MKLGMLTLGIGSATQPGIIRKVAEHAERVGVATVWAPEHIVLFDEHESKYPYSPEGKFPLPGGADWNDPFITLTYAAAVTSKVRLATGICLVPEHNPVLLAKEIATLDRLSGGRFALGVGIGWLAEEFAALGIPFERRAQRTREYLQVMRKLWGETKCSFDGEFVHFREVQSFPKPAQGADVPFIFGGESIPALKRTVDVGNGWFGFNLDPTEAKTKIEKLSTLAREKGRDLKSIEIIVSPYTKQITRDDLKRYHDCGVQEVVMLGNPPADEAAVAGYMDHMARDWVEPAAKLG